MVTLWQTQATCSPYPVFVLSYDRQLLAVHVAIYIFILDTQELSHLTLGKKSTNQHISQNTEQL